MPKLKVQLHSHSREDPIDMVKYTAHQVIDQAAKLNYDVLAITCHNVIIFNDELKNHAEEKRILLIPGIEKTIEKKHVVILNAHIDAQKIKNFEDLRNYKEEHKESLIIAVHPYFPSSTALGRRFDRFHELFDAVEYSWFHSKKINWFNRKAVQNAEKYGLPVIGTSDCHNYRYFDYTYSFIDAEKNLKSVFHAIRNNKIHLISHDLKIWKMPLIYLKMTFLELARKAILR
jgi:predicted metal-dependent phosphoesterase TrpH